jgi:serine phosphatase RsbU (regulator of sigma subunit)/CHASE2 domain-containing sensor protein
MAGNFPSLVNLLRLRDAKLRPVWIYNLIAPLALGSLMALLAGTSLFEGLENITMDFRFRSRVSLDPQADSRLLLVEIDEASLERFGRWPWPRERHGDLCKLLAVNEPAAVMFDLLFTEPGQAEDDAYFAESVRTLPRLITGALADDTAAAIQSGALRNKPIRSVHGDKGSIFGKSGARVPIPEVSSVSWFGFVNSEPSRDGVRRRLPLVIRVGDEVYPSLALQTLLLYWNVAPDKIDVQLGRWIELPTPEGLRRIPITSSGELWLNYRAKERFPYWSYQGLLEALYRDATGETPFPANVPGVKGKIIVAGQFASGLTDLGPSPLEATSPLVLTSLNALNSVLKSDYLRVVPFCPWPLLIWVATAWATLIGLRNQHILRSLLLPIAIIALYLGTAWIVFAFKSIALPVAIPVLGLAVIHVGKVIIEWIDAVFAKRQISAELIRATEAKKLLEQELEIAREIQMSTLPQVFPPFPDRPEIDLHAMMIPAKFVGGDLYEFFFVDEHKLFFVIGDVSGKGVPAALFMTMALAVIRSHVIAGRSPSETLRRSNNVLALRNERCTFVTIFCGLLNTETGHLCYANGGHNPPVLLDGEGGVSFLAEEGTAIGAIEGLEFEERELVLKVDQGLFLYTDGVTEAIDHKEELFSEERLLAALSVRHRSFTAKGLTARMHERLSEFVGGAPQFDDITALALFYRGKPKPLTPESDIHDEAASVAS